MKKSLLTRYALVPAIMAGGLLSSCHSTLYQAAQRGDLDAVRQEVALNRGNTAALKGGPPASNLVWVAPAACMTIPVDLTLLISSAFTYGVAMKNGYTLSDAVWKNFYVRSSAIEAAYENGNVLIANELMNAGAETPEHVRAWLATPGCQAIINGQNQMSEEKRKALEAQELIEEQKRVAERKRREEAERKRKAEAERKRREEEEEKKRQEEAPKKPDPSRPIPA